ncbi:hypothetical protein ACFV9E_09670 [Streptomyces sp. NPDC059835]
MNSSLIASRVEITNTTRDAIGFRGGTLRDRDGNRYCFVGDESR